MLIKSISSNQVDRFGRVYKRTTNYGQYKGYSIAIESDAFKGNVLRKQIIIWNDRMQKIVNKFRKENGKFERIG